MLIAAERERPDVAERREEFKREQPLLNLDRLVFIDKTWAKTNMPRPRGRAPKGERLLASVPHGHWNTTTFLAALRTTGLTAPLVMYGPSTVTSSLGGFGTTWCRRSSLETSS